MYQNETSKTSSNTVINIHARLSIGFSSQSDPHAEADPGLGPQQIVPKPEGFDPSGVHLEFVGDLD
jgi:hypothetical protein